MTRSLKVLVNCDYCDIEIEEGEDHEGSLTLTINGVGPRQIDLCGPCLGGDTNYLYVNGMLELFEKADDLPTSPPSAVRRARNTNGGPAQCPVCPHVAGSPQGLGRHTREAHGRTVAQLRGEAP